MIQLPSNPPSRPSTQGSLIQSQNPHPHSRPKRPQTSSPSSPSHSPSNYIININLSSLNSRNYQKQKIKEQYLDHFRNKLGMRSKSRVLPGSQDYLYKLTTKEIDNLVKMERNRYVGSEREFEMASVKKDGSERESPDKKHIRVYRPSFLCKLSKIVKKTNFFDKSDNLISYHYKSQNKKKNPRYVSGDTMPQSECFQHDNLDNFSVIGKGIKDVRERSSSDAKGKERKKGETWFSGMSRSLIQQKEEKEEPVWRGMNLEKKGEVNGRLRTSHY